MGLGLGVAMSAFTSIVQNQYPVHRLGEVLGQPAVLPHHRQHLGLAVFGSVLNNQFTTQLATNLPAPVVKGLKGPSSTTSTRSARSQAQSGSRRSWRTSRRRSAPLPPLGLIVTHGLRLSLDRRSTACSSSRRSSGSWGFVVVLFLPEVPLRQTHSLAELDDDVGSERSPGGGALVVETVDGE